jgi:SpoIIAA-like
MNNIEVKNYGFKLVFTGQIKTEEMQEWIEKSKKKLLNSPREFGVLIDMRTLKPLAPEAQVYMIEGQKLYKQKGMKRSAVVINSATTKMQFQRLAKDTGIYEWERYIDASTTPNWEKVGESWIIDSIDPDK